MKKIIILCFLVISVLMLCENKKRKEFFETMININENIDLSVSIYTEKGIMDIKLYPQKAPFTVLNYINLSLLGYYDNLKFHRVINDFMVQGGDPTGSGSGGPGYNFKDEFYKDLEFNSKGILAMANAGPNTNGSQFFITHVNTPWLNNKHTIFGKLTSGEEVLDSIKENDIIEKIVVKGNYKEFIDDNKEFIDEMNKIIFSNFPNLDKNLE